jgi:hypothetical protein
MFTVLYCTVQYMQLLMLHGLGRIGDWGGAQRNASPSFIKKY